MVIFCSRPVPMSLAETLTMPLASISKATSTCGMPQVEVAFDIDANGIVNVSAKDMGTGREQKITITSSSGLSKDEIDKMMRDAESHASDDVKKREEIEARNRLDSLVYQMEKTLADNREKVGAVAEEVETAIAEAKKALVEGGVEKLN